MPSEADISGCKLTLDMSRGCSAILLLPDDSTALLIRRNRCTQHNGRRCDKALTGSPSKMRHETGVVEVSFANSPIPCDPPRGQPSGTAGRPAYRLTRTGRE